MCFLKTTMLSFSLHFAKLENILLSNLLLPVTLLISPILLFRSCSHYHVFSLYLIDCAYTQASGYNLLAALKNGVSNPLFSLKTPYLLQ